MHHVTCMLDIFKYSQFKVSAFSLASGEYVLSVPIATYEKRKKDVQKALMFLTTIKLMHIFTVKFKTF